MPTQNQSNTLPDWEVEFNATALKYHKLIAWVAVILNPLWIIGDYFNIPNHFTDFFAFRLIVSTATLIPLLFYKKFVHIPYVIALVPFTGIAIQNAYMYSVMTVPQIQQHTFAYIALFIGGGMFVLWKPAYSFFVVGISFIANIIFFNLLSPTPVKLVLINGGFLTASVAAFTILLIHTRTKQTQREIKTRMSLIKSNRELELKNKLIALKNKDIRDSINYARRIQEGILPSNADLDAILGNYFILYKPKDVVSGDFYWAITTTTSDSKIRLSVFATIDCTGHGVPGAFMSMVGKTLLNQTIKNANINSPADALNYLNHELPKNLKAHEVDSTIKDGMDISLGAIDYENKMLYFAGAHNPCWIIRNGAIIELKADKFSISATLDEHKKSFTNQQFALETGDLIYLFTDGYADQFGMPEKEWGPIKASQPNTTKHDEDDLLPEISYGKKFKYKQLKDILLAHWEKPLVEQKQILSTTFESWKGLNNQTDDVCIMCIKMI